MEYFDARYKIICRSKRLPLWASEIRINKHAYFPPTVIVVYQSENDREPLAKHVQAFNWADMQIECLTKEAKEDLVKAKERYEQLKKTS